MIGSGKIRVVTYGMGQIGLATATRLLGRKDIQLVGAIDNDPKMQQRDVADLAGLKQPSGVRLSDRADEVLQVTRPDVVILSTGSRFASVQSQIRDCIKARCHVVSSCEELLAPHVQYAAQAKELDRMAKDFEAVVLGTGVNPGFVMDTMALVATAPCIEVKSVTVERVVDATTRRENLQKKIGAGLTPAQFRKGVKKKELGHVGLLESTYLVAEGIGWSLEKVTEKLTPVLAKKGKKTPWVTVRAGQVAGIHHVCRGYRNNKECVSLDLQMFVGAKKPHDRISVNGKPGVELLFENGVAGDEATVAMLIAMVPAVAKMEPGLRTMIDAPLPRYRAGN
ncbi:MAG TPA: dihydrodipicolinate reductase [Vicinamibacteria bacterium]|nr:dihydrodipicolinate reductase [Vicinamibacteria bacterium]